MAAVFQFYEIVKVSYKCEIPELVGLEGTVLGMAQNDQGEWGYAISIHDLDECWDLMEEELESTGRMNRRENFYDGTHIRARVDLETGEGKIVDNDGLKNS